MTVHQAGCPWHRGRLCWQFLCFGKVYMQVTRGLRRPSLDLGSLGQCGTGSPWTSLGKVKPGHDACVLLHADPSGLPPSARWVHLGCTWPWFLSSARARRSGGGRPDRFQFSFVVSLRCFFGWPVPPFPSVSSLRSISLMTWPVQWSWDFSSMTKEVASA